MIPTFLRQLFAQIPDRTKVIILALAAFLIGTIFAGTGGGAAGRYAVVASDSSWIKILDTKTGAVWEATTDTDHPGAYKRSAGFPYF